MPHNVFISRPTTVNKLQSKFCDNLEAALRIRGLRLRSLGITDYSNKAPLLGVRLLLNECEGVIILGLKQIFVTDCSNKNELPKGREGRQFYLPTSWNHLEGGIAIGLNLPLLIICEQGVEGGLFDQGVTNKFIHHVNLSIRGEKDESQSMLDIESILHQKSLSSR